MNKFQFLFQIVALFRAALSSYERSRGAASTSQDELVELLSSRTTPEMLITSDVEDSNAQLEPQPQEPSSVIDLESVLVGVPEEVFAKVLPFLDDEHCDNFRKASKWHKKIFDKFKEVQWYDFEQMTKLFDDLSISQTTKYHSLESVPIITDVYMDVNDEESIDGLARKHYLSNQEIFRGLDKETNRPFLSLSLLHRDRSRRDAARMIICVFGTDCVQIDYQHDCLESKRLERPSGEQSETTLSLTVEEVSEMLGSNHHWILTKNDCSHKCGQNLRQYRADPWYYGLRLVIKVLAFGGCVVSWILFGVLSVGTAEPS